MHRALIAEFTRRLGFSAAPDGEEGAHFSLPGLGRFELEVSGDRTELLLGLSLPLPPYDTEKLLAALGMCHPDRPHPFPLACGLARDSLVLFSRRKIEGANAALLENQAIFLLDCAKTLGFAGA
jgi:type III secretion system chaperone SycN